MVKSTTYPPVRVSADDIVTVTSLVNPWIAHVIQGYPERGVGNAIRGWTRDITVTVQLVSGVCMTICGWMSQ